MVRGAEPISDRSKFTVVWEPDSFVAVTENCTAPWKAGISLFTAPLKIGAVVKVSVSCGTAALDRPLVSSLLWTTWKPWKGLLLRKLCTCCMPLVKACWSCCSWNLSTWPEASWAMPCRAVRPW